MDLEQLPTLLPTSQPMDTGTDSGVSFGPPTGSSVGSQGSQEEDELDPFSSPLTAAATELPLDGGWRGRAQTVDVSEAASIETKGGKNGVFVKRNQRDPMNNFKSSRQFKGGK